MISFEQARQLVADKVCKPIEGLPDDDEIVIQDSATIERPWGWVFFYTSKKWLETHDIHYAIAGNAPYIVERESGNLVVTGTAMPIEHYIEHFERTGKPK